MGGLAALMITLCKHIEQKEEESMFGMILIKQGVPQKPKHDKVNAYYCRLTKGYCVGYDPEREIPGSNRLDSRAIMRCPSAEYK